jgi:hypothetical protein
MIKFARAAAISMPLALPAAAQDEDDANVAGTVTATINSEERAFIVVQDGSGAASSFERTEGDVIVRLVSVPDRTPTDASPVLRIEFTVAGMGPTADATDAVVTYVDDDGQTLSSLEGTSEVSMTAFGLESDEVTTAGNFASQLRAEDGGMADAAIEGDFQASVRQQDFVGTN